MGNKNVVINNENGTIIKNQSNIKNKTIKKYNKQKTTIQIKKIIN